MHREVGGLVVGDWGAAIPIEKILRSRINVLFKGVKYVLEMTIVHQKNCEQLQLRFERSKRLNIA